MKSIRIEAPAFQNWSCHGCTQCCRGQLAVEISAGEKKRIEEQKWSKAEGVDPDEMFVADGDRFRLAHQADGACVFLDASGRCRIHARFGEKAKPLACRLYPLAIHPAGGKLVVSLRFDCPSAAGNRGRPLAEQSKELRELAQLVVPANFTAARPPAVLREPVKEWRDFMRFVSMLDAALSDPKTPVALKLARALHWLGAIEKAEFDAIKGPEADEIYGALCRRAGERLPSLLEIRERPSRVGRMLFRTLVMEYARSDAVKEMGETNQWRMLRGMIRFATGVGQAPALRRELKSAPFAAIEKPFGELPVEAEATLTRYFRVKIQGLHFCGPAYYDLPLIEGFRHLALLFPVILWLSRWLAAGGQRSSLTEADVARAISIADHSHGYSPRFGSAGARRRVRLLSQRNDIARLCAWYML